LPSYIDKEKLRVLRVLNQKFVQIKCINVEIRASGAEDTMPFPFPLVVDDSINIRFYDAKIMSIPKEKGNYIRYLD